MNHGKISIVIMAIFLAIVGGVSADSTWWDSDYQYRQQVTIDNNADSVMEAGYTVDVDISGITGSLANGDDIRVVYNGVELDRLIDAGKVTFATQAAIAAQGSDSDYYIYYGNADAGAAPADGNNVYVAFDDFSNNQKHNDWTEEFGTWEPNSMLC